MPTITKEELTRALGILDSIEAGADEVKEKATNCRGTADGITKAVQAMFKLLNEVQGHSAD